MHLLRQVKLYLSLMFFVSLGVLLMYSNQLVYGVVLVLASFMVYFLWKHFVKTQQEQILNLQVESKNKDQIVTKLTQEVEELRHRKLNIADIKHILELGLIEVDTYFVRVFNEDVPHDKKSVRFIGALRVDMIAKYGIDLRELRFKPSSSTNEVMVANVNPKFLSFSRRETTWQIAEVLEEKKPWFSSEHWATDSSLERIGNEIKERYRKRIEKETESGPDEVKWIIEPLRKQIHGALQLLLGSTGRSVKIVDNPDKQFLPLEDLKDL